TDVYVNPQKEIEKRVEKSGDFCQNNHEPGNTNLKTLKKKKKPQTSAVQSARYFSNHKASKSGCGRTKASNHKASKSGCGRTKASNHKASKSSSGRTKASNHKASKSGCGRTKASNHKASKSGCGRTKASNHKASKTSRKQEFTTLQEPRIYRLKGKKGTHASSKFLRNSHHPLTKSINISNKSSRRLLNSNSNNRNYLRRKSNHYNNNNFNKYCNNFHHPEKLKKKVQTPISNKLTITCA
ncbi:hypothetical protein Avbf_12979, partial [Armadillidium vulgare]